RRQYRHFFVVYNGAGACADDPNVKAIVLFQFVYRAHQLTEISRREIGRRLRTIRLIERGTVADRDHQRADRGIGWYDQGYALDKLGAVIVSREGLHLDAFATTHFSLVHPQAVQSAARPAID